MAANSRSRWTLEVCFSLLIAVGSLHADAFKSSIEGNPGLQTIDVISFGPEGLLLVGDGRGAQIVAIQTGDTSPRTPIQTETTGIDSKLASRIGAPPKGIEILDLATNPASGVAYFAVRKQDDKRYLILTLDGKGDIGEFSLEKVRYAKLSLPTGEQGAAHRITDIAWAGDRVLAAARSNEEFGSKLFTASVPIAHASPATIASTETYHVAHGKWETKAPMSTIMPFQEEGKQYIAGAFSCTPVVKYPVEAIQPGAKVKGTSVLELGSGNQPLDMFTYEKDGRQYVLANTYRFHHQKKPFGPSPYWTVRFDRDLLDEEAKVNEQALRRLGGNGQPASERVQLIEPYFGVVQMDKLDASRALAVRTNGDGQFDLVVLPLP